MLLVLGPHRSGTSVIARLLECLGARNSARIIAGDGNNPTGYFEDADINNFNDTILLPRLGLTWHSTGFVDWSRLNKTDRSRLGLQALEIVRRNYPANQPLSVLKEPRIGTLLPFWLSVLTHAGYDVRIVCVVRDPVSIARSLAVRDNFSLTHGGMLYTTIWLSILPHLEDLPVALAAYDTVCSHPGLVLRSVAEKLGLPLPADLEECLHEFTSNHLDLRLRHSRLPAEDVALEPDLPPLAVDLHQALLAAARSQNIKKAARFALASDRIIEAFRPVLADFDQLQSYARGGPTATEPAAAFSAAASAAEVARERDQFAAQLAETQAARKELAARLAAAEVAQQEMAARQAAFAETTARLNAAEQELQRMRTHAAEQTEAVARLEEANRFQEDLAAQHRCLLAEHIALEDERDQLQVALDEARSAQQNQTSRLNELEVARQELAARHASLQTTQGEMAARVAELDNLRTEITNRHSALGETQARLTAAEQALAEARAAREKADTDAKDLREENELLLNQLHQVQEELEKCVLENRDLKQSTEQLRASEKEHTALNALHQELVTSHSQLVSRHTSLTTELETLRSEHSSLLTRHSSLVTAFKELESKHSSLVAERDDLATRHSSLVTAFEKLEGHHSSLAASHEALESLAARRLQELAKLGAMVVQKTAVVEELETVAAYCGENNFSIQRIEVLDSHETPPHRHLNLVLRDVSIAGHPFKQLPVRLVEHHGRVGLVFLRPPDGSDAPLQGWIESGRDGETAYMIVIPEDTASRAFLETANGSDFYFIQFLASKLDDALLNRYAHCPAAGWEAARVRKWLPVARALVRQLEQLPTRLRYDRATLAPGTQPGAWAFDFSNVFFGGRSMARLACELRPTAHAKRGEILLRLTEASAAPLLAWPHHDDHTPASEVVVTLEPASWAAPRTANGSTLESTDQAFLRSLVAELPAVTESLAASQGLTAKDRSQLFTLARRAAAAGTLHLSY
jgi:hypothetical protein